MENNSKEIKEEKRIEKLAASSNVKFKLDEKAISNSINSIKKNVSSRRQTIELKLLKEKKNVFNKKKLGASIENKKKILSKEYVFNFLAKNPTSRTLSEIRNVAEYLSDHYDYFTKLKNEDSQLKVEKLTKICRLEKYLKGESIIKFGEIGDKFYIVLEGIVEIYKPKYVEINETPLDFMNLLIEIKEMDGNDLRYKRIFNKNHDFFVGLPEKDINKLIKEFEHMTYKQLFLMEEDEKMGEYGEGFSFGDIALIKNSVRNATIKAKEGCTLLTIGKDDYNKAILEFQKRILSKEIDAFVKTYSFFHYFTNDKVIQLFNCLTRVELYKGEYLYKQNMNADSIYILNNGAFLIYSTISFSWINDFINYIDYSEKNILQHIIKNKNFKIGDLIKIIKNFHNEDKNSKIEKKSNKIWEKLDERRTNDNLYKLKKDEEKLNSPENTFQINLKKINYSEILGLEEVFEFKKRFCSCKCISEKAELKAIKITELLKLICNFNGEELTYLLNIINERKQVLKSELLNGIKNLDKELIFNFDIRYENIIKSSEDKKKEEEEKSNMLLTAIKMKGYKTSIQDILDNNISLFPKEKNNNASILKKMRRKNKSSEQIMNDYIKKKGTLNQFKYNQIKNSFINENQNNFKKSVFNNITNKFQNKTPNNGVSIDNNKRYSIINLNKINKSTSINKISPFKLKRTRSIQKKIIKNVNRNIMLTKEIINKHFEKFNISNKNLTKREINNKKDLAKSKSLPEFFDKNIIKKRPGFRDTISVFDTVNLPYFSLTKKNYEENNKNFLKDENSYKTFFNIFNEDKNFFLGAEFQKKLKKEYKLLDSVYDENIIKKKIKIKSDYFL